MKIVWDEPKRLANLDKHGFDFAEVDSFGWTEALVTVSHSSRYKAIGWFGDRLIVVIYSRLGTEAVSIVGIRAANRKEKRLHEEDQRLHGR